MKSIFYSLLMLLIFSCDEAKTGKDSLVKKSDYSIVQKHEQIALVQKKYQSKIDEWKEYDNLIEFLNQYNAISPNDAINNSNELNDKAKSLKDSIKPEILETPAFNARLNLLLNETLRLYDMSSIPSIKAVEVNEQVTKILLAFSAINSKINTTLRQAELEGEISEIEFKNDMPSKPFNLESKLPKKTSFSKKKSSLKFQKMRLLEEERMMEKKKLPQKRKKDDR